MSNNITVAATNYANRPQDERFPSVAALVERATHDRALSAERDYNLKDLKIIPSDGGLAMLSPKGEAAFSHWSFGQFSRMVGAPAAYLRSLPAQIAADALNYGISDSTPGTRASLLVQAPNGAPKPVVRAATSDSYSRVWDDELYGAIQQTIVARDDRWSLPPTWSGESAGAYRGDRDSFLVLVNGGSIVTDPSAGSNAGNQMYRGLLVRNSEVGASSITIESILFRYICGNHILWGAAVDKSFRRRHVGTRIVSDTMREVATFAQRYVNQSTERDNAIIRLLIDRELATTKEAVVDELRGFGATKEQAIAAYDRCEREELVSPRSFWGAMQGLTRVSQDNGYQDDRFQLDQIAAKVLARGTKLVTV